MPVPLLASCKKMPKAQAPPPHFSPTSKRHPQAARTCSLYHPYTISSPYDILLFSVIFSVFSLPTM